MKIGDKEYRFALPVRAAIDIAKMCPGGTLSNIDSWLEGADEVVYTRFAKIAVVMNKAAVRQERFANGESVTDWSQLDCLTEEMVMDMPFAKFAEMRREIMAAFRGDAKTTVAVEPDKKKENTAI